MFNNFCWGAILPVILFTIGYYIYMVKSRESRGGKFTYGNFYIPLKIWESNIWWGSWPELFQAIGKFFLSWSAIIFFSMLIGIVFPSGYISNTIEEKTIIYSLQDNPLMDVSGSFRMGYGVVNSEASLNYYFMLKDDKGRYHVETLSSNNTFIVPESENTETYYIKRYVEKQKIFRKNILMGGYFNVPDGDIILDDGEKEYDIEYEIHLPEDYISINYNIDLQ